MESLSAFVKRNDALKINPPSAAIHITSRGSDWLWTVFAINYFSLVVFLGLLFRTPRRDRIFHYISILTVTLSGICYFTMASDIGSMAVAPEWVRSSHEVAGATRQVFWIRYLDWFTTMPLIIFNVLLTAGVYWHTILYTVMMSIIFVILFFVGAIVPDTYRWGYYTIGTVALFLALENIVWAGITHANALGGNIKKFYTFLGPYVFILWILYPICWACSEGGNVIAPDSEQIFYGILDVFSKPILCWIILFAHTRIDITQLDLRLYDRGDVERITPRFNEKEEERGAAAANNDPAQHV
ncbi:uncharacterized protein N7518_010410 [Penicillium psychrosexuale]|uniref:uncharacterized protein n=1 Tax=Penicillium psychrosexuale TaxID=1002107 RepID=UPI002544D3BE|nr:uncharacterized protein N7518_010410 [Penicillium psychrosexuale]KAJ5781927.1 hypothetical protein N7518_010410 [Penicillium psychrosexuale]